MNENDYQKLHGELGFSFSLYITSHLDSPLLELLDASEPALTFLTDDPGFNAWSLQAAAQTRARDDVPDRPIALYYIPVPRPPSADDVDWSRATILGRYVLKPASGSDLKVAV